MASDEALDDDVPGDVSPDDTPDVSEKSVVKGKIKLKTVRHR
jgi:hypothetical protein